MTIQHEVEAPNAPADLTPLDSKQVRLYMALDAAGEVMGSAVENGDDWKAINALYDEAQERGYKWVARIFRLDSEHVIEDFTT